jgi:hypothetical protein
MTGLRKMGCVVASWLEVADDYVGWRALVFSSFERSYSVPYT